MPASGLCNERGRCCWKTEGSQGKRLTGGQAFVSGQGGDRLQEQLQQRSREGQREPPVVLWDALGSSRKGLSLLMVAFTASKGV